MATFDVAIAIDQEELTSSSQAIYSVTYPHIFTGDFQYQELTIHWDVQTAPVFDLAPSEDAKAALVNHLQTLEQSASHAGLAVHNVSALMSEQVPTLSIRLPEVILTIKTPGLRDASLVLMNTTTYCYTRSANGAISILPTKVTADQQRDPLYDLIVQEFLLPEVKQAMTDHLANLTLPSLNLPGVTLSPPSIAIEGGHLVAAANLAAKGTPPPPNGTLWTTSGFTALVGQEALQALAAYAVSIESNTLNDKGRDESWGFGYYWSYSGSLGYPGVAIHHEDTGIDITLPVSVTLEAGGIVFGGEIGIGYEILVQPDPIATCSLVVSGRQVQITLVKLNTFLVLAKPTGSVAEQIAGWMLAGIVNAFTASFSALLSTFIKDIRFPPITVPAFKTTVEGITYTITPTGLTFSNLNDQIAIGGHMAISQG